MDEENFSLIASLFHVAGGLLIIAPLLEISSMGNILLLAGGLLISAGVIFTGLGIRSEASEKVFHAHFTAAAGLSLLTLSAHLARNFHSNFLFFVGAGVFLFSIAYIFYSHTLPMLRSEIEQ